MLKFIRGVHLAIGRCAWVIPRCFQNSTPFLWYTGPISTWVNPQIGSSIYIYWDLLELPMDSLVLIHMETEQIRNLQVLEVA